MDKNIIPGDLSGIYPENWGDADSVAESVCRDVESLGGKARPLTREDDLVYDYEYRIALRISSKDHEYSEKLNQEIHSFHFMVQTSTGQWAHKRGTQGNSDCWDLGMTAAMIDWTPPLGVPNYDGDIIYLAIKMNK